MKDEVSEGDLLLAVGTGLVISAESFEEPRYNLFWQREIGFTEVDLEEEDLKEPTLKKHCTRAVLYTAYRT